MKGTVKLTEKTFKNSDAEGTWIISYADMITLLLSFFVLFFSFDFNKVQDEKLRENIIQKLEMIGELDSMSKQFFEENSSEIISIDPVELVVKEDEKGRIVIFFKNANFFDTGDTSLNIQGLFLLEEFSDKFMPYAGKYKIKIFAFTDDVPVSQKRRYKDNIELSALRSVSVLRALQSNGIPIEKTEISGKGIMSKKILKLVGSKTDDIEALRYSSRTVALMLVKES